MKIERSWERERESNINKVDQKWCIIFVVRILRERKWFPGFVSLDGFRKPARVDVVYLVSQIMSLSFTNSEKAKLFMML